MESLKCNTGPSFTFLKRSNAAITFSRASQSRRGRPNTRHSLSNFRIRASFDFPQVLSEYLTGLTGSVNSFDSFSMLVGVLGGFTAYAMGKSLRRRTITDRECCEGVLLASPTPFNRFVVLRCPSISVEDDGFLENANEKLSKAHRHNVKLSCGGKIHRKVLIEDDLWSGDFNYQRICLNADDGGVIALDWPASLDLRGEHGLDSVVLVVPGTAEGSEDTVIRKFVHRALQHGLFPIVMNPRGCAGSPLTTSRLFTAADSEDVRLVASFIARSRPRSSLVAVGWGYGANMLTKYIGEAAESTPVVAAVSIGNPFDLQEAFSAHSYRSVTEKNLVEGLQDILKRNKALFQGKRNHFDVEKALSAMTVREFEKVISSVVHGFDTVDDFYARSSSKDIIGKIRIPMLFIQNDEITTPAFSVPRNKIEDNPFTSLLMCSLTSNLNDERSQSTTRQWCEKLVLEWFMAVEFALMKGRHPLIKDVDITIKTKNELFSKRWLPGGNGSNINEVEDKIVASTNDFAAKSFPYSYEKKPFLESVGGAYARAKDGNNESPLKEQGTIKKTACQKVGNQTSGIEVGKTVEIQSNLGEAESGQVLHAAETIMKALDVTMPGTLAEDQKKQVLNAVQRGETVISALQGAVPENVRGKLTSAVSSAVQAQQINLKLVGLQKHIPSTVLKNNISKEISTKQNAVAEEQLEGKAVNDNRPLLDVSGAHTSEEREYNVEPSYCETSMEVTMDPSKEASSVENKVNENVKGPHTSEHSLERQLENERPQENAIEDTVSRNMVYRQTNSNNETVKSENDIDQTKSKEVKVEKSVVSGLPKDVSEKERDEASINSRDEHHQSSESKGNELSQQIGIGANEQCSKKGETGIQGATENDQTSKKDMITDKKNDETSLDNQIDQNAQNIEAKGDSMVSQVGASNTSPSIGVKQALDALTGFDDSTQMAVTNVFGVIEDMIEQLEKEKKVQANDKKPNKLDGEEQEIITSRRRTLQSRQTGGSESNKQSHGSLDDCQKHESTIQKTQECAKVEDIAFRIARIEKQSKENNIASCTTGFNSDKQNDFTAEGKESANSAQGKELRKVSGLISCGINNDDEQNAFRNLEVNDVEAFLHPNASYLSLTCPKKDTANDKNGDDLFLEYVPEENKWKYWDEIVSVKGTRNSSQQGVAYADGCHTNEEIETDMPFPLIEPSYVILDTQNGSSRLEKKSTLLKQYHKNCQSPNQREELENLVRNAVVNALGLELIRRIGLSDVKELQNELNKDIWIVASAIVFVVQHFHKVGEVLPPMTNVSGELTTSRRCVQKRFGTLHAEKVVDAISSALEGTSLLSKIVPNGVIIGASLAALRPMFLVVTYEGIIVGDGNYYNQLGTQLKDFQSTQKNDVHTNQFELNSTILADSNNQKDVIHCDQDISKNEESQRKGHGAVVGAMTAAVGATMAITSQSVVNDNTSNENGHVNGKDNMHLLSKNDSIETYRNVDDGTGEQQNLPSIVNTIAEKAISVAAPVVPMKNDGAVDTERLVAVLAELSQKGGVLRLIGKVALLWGGLRGAMSLTDRLIMFFDISKRRLPQRLFGFACMLFLVWSPVIVPLLPTILQHWSSGTPLGIAGFASKAGLYGAIIILVTIWGKRIRGYDRPLKEYGLSFSSVSKIVNLSMGVLVGLLLILSLQMIHVLLGYVSFSVKPEYLFLQPMGIVSRIEHIWKLVRLVISSFGRGLLVSIIQELVFRSWLHEEIAGDLGFHRAIILSGFAFSAMHWSMSFSSKVALWLLSLALSGAREKCNGDLSLPIGLHTALIAGNFLIESVFFVTCNSNAPSWLFDSFVGNPFPGALGLILLAILALFLYPWNKGSLTNFKKNYVIDNQCLEENS